MKTNCTGSSVNNVPVSAEVMPMPDSPGWVSHSASLIVAETDAIVQNTQEMRELMTLVKVYLDRTHAVKVEDIERLASRVGALEQKITYLLDRLGMAKYEQKAAREFDREPLTKGYA
jgi:Na+/phosphate symporter